MPIKFGETLAAKREANDIGMQDIACFIGCCRSTEASWERGTTIPNTVTVLRLAKLFDITLHEMVTGEPFRGQYFLRDDLDVKNISKHLQKAYKGRSLKKNYDRFYLSYNAYHGYLSGKMIPAPDILLIFARDQRCSLDDLLTPIK